MLAEVKADRDSAHDPGRRADDVQRDEDILHSYQLHANAYVTKPVGLRRLHDGRALHRALLRARRAAAADGASVRVVSRGRSGR